MWFAFRESLFSRLEETLQGCKREGKEARNKVTVVRARDNGMAHSHQHESNLPSFYALGDRTPRTSYCLLPFLFEENVLQIVIDIQSSVLLPVLLGLSVSVWVLVTTIYQPLPAEFITDTQTEKFNDCWCLSHSLSNGYHVQLYILCLHKGSWQGGPRGVPLARKHLLNYRRQLFSCESLLLSLHKALKQQ